MNKSDEYKKLSKKLNQANSKANKRLRRLKAKGLKTPAYQQAIKSGGHFHNHKDMSYQEMQKEYHRVNNFLNAKTSTHRGAVKVVNEVLGATGLDKKYTSGDLMSKKKTMDKFFQVYSRMQDYDKASGRYRAYRTSFNAISNYVKTSGLGGSIDKILAGVLANDKI